MRDAPSIDIIKGLQAAGALIKAYDPESMEQAKLNFQDVSYAQTAYACCEDADALVIITEWEQFRALDLPRIKSTMLVPIMMDLRNIYRSDEMQKIGFHYSSIGRP
jgi:UDPglucose 6-dehydrogenase